MNNTAHHEVLNRCHQLALNKNAAYGDAPLLRHGMHGVIVRMSDKMARIENVWRKSGIVIKTETKDTETIIDTAMDIINYAAYLVMMIEGTFTHQHGER